MKACVLLACGLVMMGLSIVMMDCQEKKPRNDPLHPSIANRRW